jgi:hypothetical protein
MADHRKGPIKGNKLKNLLQAIDGDLPDPGIDGARSQVHERGMESNRQSFVPKTGGHFHEILSTETIKTRIIEAYFRVDSLLDDHREKLTEKKMERHMNLNSP